MNNITLNDFKPFNQWQQDVNGPTWEYEDEPKYLIDNSTGRRYWNESKNTVGFKCFLLVIGTPFVHSITTVLKIAKIFTLAHFWLEKDSEKNYSFKSRAKEAGEDLLRVIASPLTIIGLEVSAIFGVLTPYNGRKLYASFERAHYGDAFLAPCFQPSPTQHALGGNPEKRNAF